MEIYVNIYKTTFIIDEATSTISYFNKRKIPYLICNWHKSEAIKRNLKKKNPYIHLLISLPRNKIKSDVDLILSNFCKYGKEFEGDVEYIKKIYSNIDKWCIGYFIDEKFPLENILNHKSKMMIKCVNSLPSF